MGCSERASMMLTTWRARCGMGVPGVRWADAKHRAIAFSMRSMSNGTMRPSRLTMVVGIVTINIEFMPDCLSINMGEVLRDVRCACQKGNRCRQTCRPCIGAVLDIILKG